MEHEMARPIHRICNEQVKAELGQYFDWNDLPAEYDDIIYGACGQTNGTKRISHKWMFRLLQSLSELSTTAIGTVLNNKRVAIGEKPLSTRSIEKYTAILRCASQGIEHNLRMGGHWVEDFVIPAQTANLTPSVPLTDSVLDDIVAKYA